MVISVRRQTYNTYKCEVSEACGYFLACQLHIYLISETLGEHECRNSFDREFLNKKSDCGVCNCKEYDIE
jgi:hypothetical protein